MSVQKILLEIKLGALEESVRVWMTPRRIALFISGLPERTLQQSLTVLGPREDTLKDGLGRFTERATAFARAHEIGCEALRLENGRIAYTKVVPPVKVVEALKEKLPQAVWAIPFAKTMRWEATGQRFARPIRGIVAFWDARLLRDWRWVPGVIVNNVTEVGAKKVKISSASSYQEKLAQQGVILDLDKKRRHLKQILDKKIQGLELRNPNHEALLEELADLVERPRVILGDFFDSSFALMLPEEVMVAILGQLKLFALKKDDKVELEPKFSAVVEAPERERSLVAIEAGYTRVVKAKVFDAYFFWEQDQQKEMEVHAEKLKGIVFSKEMGSLWDKVVRVEKTATNLVSSCFTSAVSLGDLNQAALLYKADVATSLVGEYPALAGKVGFHYARNQELSQKKKPVPPGVCQAIRECVEWNPEKASPLGLALGIADRLDTLLAQFALGNKPSATEDPLGLKKIADFIIESFWVKDSLSCSIRDVIHWAWQSFEGFKRDPKEECFQYLKTRLILKAKEAGFGSDRIEATLAGERAKDLMVSDIKECLKALRALEESQPDTLAAMAGAFKRTANILRQAQKLGVDMDHKNRHPDEAIFGHTAERDLWKSIVEARGIFGEALPNRDYHAVFEGVARLASPLENFFKSVMVLTNDERMKENRLALLGELYHLVLQVMDPAKLLIKGEAQRSPQLST